MRISDWSSDVCSSDLLAFDDVYSAMLPALAFLGIHALEANFITPLLVGRRLTINPLLILLALSFWGWVWGTIGALLSVPLLIMMRVLLESAGKPDIAGFLFEERSEEHTSELQSLMRISYAVFCLKKKTLLISEHHIRTECTTTIKNN